MAAAVTIRRRIAVVAIALAILVPAVRAQEPGGIVFVGSSIFHRWTALTAQMAPLPVSNVSLDGGMTYEMLGLLGSRVLPLKPRVVAYYAGSNDVDLDEPANAVVGRVVQFIDRLEAALPRTHVVYVSVIRSPDHADRWKVIDQINQQIQKYATTHLLVHFVDVNPLLVDAAGKPRFDLYMPDERHLRPAAYVEVAKIVKPMLEQVLGAP